MKLKLHTGTGGSGNVKAGHILGLEMRECKSWLHTRTGGRGNVKAGHIQGLEGDGM